MGRSPWRRLTPDLTVVQSLTREGTTLIQRPAVRSTTSATRTGSRTPTTAGMEPSLMSTLAPVTTRTMSTAAPLEKVMLLLRHLRPTTLLPLRITSLSQISYHQPAPYVAPAQPS